MIHVEIVGAGGWLSVLLFAGLIVALPWWGHTLGRLVARDEADEQRHQEFMRAHGGHDAG